MQIHTYIHVQYLANNLKQANNKKTKPKEKFKRISLFVNKFNTKYTYLNE